MKDLIIIVVGLVLFALVWGLWSSFMNIEDHKETNSSNVACTLDAKLCPDGSAVGRVGPHCEFAECPQ